MTVVIGGVHNFHKFCFCQLNFWFQFQYHTHLDGQKKKFPPGCCATKRETSCIQVMFFKKLTNYQVVPVQCKSMFWTAESRSQGSTCSPSQHAQIFTVQDKARKGTSSTLVVWVWGFFEHIEGMIHGLPICLSLNRKQPMSSNKNLQGFIISAKFNLFIIGSTAGFCTMGLNTKQPQKVWSKRASVSMTKQKTWENKLWYLCQMGLTSEILYALILILNMLIRLKRINLL